LLGETKGGKRWLAGQGGLRPATQARLLARWIVIAAIAFLIVLAYFLLGVPARA
jgi:hypothetical protein